MYLFMKFYLALILILNNGHNCFDVCTFALIHKTHKGVRKHMHTHPHTTPPHTHTHTHKHAFPTTQYVVGKGHNFSVSGKLELPLLSGILNSEIKRLLCLCSHVFNHSPVGENCTALTLRSLAYSSVGEDCTHNVSLQWKMPRTGSVHILIVTMWKQSQPDSSRSDSFTCWIWIFFLPLILQSVGQLFAYFDNFSAST